MMRYSRDSFYRVRELYGKSGQLAVREIGRNKPILKNRTAPEIEQAFEMANTAAMLGAVPLAIGFGEGSELRRPLGLSIIGGLMVSQVLTLYTTPVIYLYLDRFRLWAQARWVSRYPRPDRNPSKIPGE